MKRIARFLTKNWKVTVPVIIVLAIIGSITEEPIEETTKATTEKSMEAEPKEKEPMEKKKEVKIPTNFEEQVLFAVEGVAGEKANTDKPKVRDITINENFGTDTEGDKVVMLDLNPNDNLTLKMMRRGMLMESSDIYKKLTELPEATDISITYYGTTVDDYGEESDSLIMQTNLTRKSLDRINWDNFSSESLPDISEGYLEHPDLRE